jgi:Ca-activated chloride channel family protein
MAGRSIRIAAFALIGTLITGVLVIPGQSSGQLRVDVQLVTVNFAVDDAAGRPVLNLGKGDFTVLEDGEPREIQSFESAETPYNILLLFDRSSSTQDQWRFIIRAINRFIDQMPDQHRIALAAFDDKPEMLMKWSNPDQFKRQSFDLKEDSGGSNVYRALEWAMQELRGIKGRKGMIVFTDGVDNLLSNKLVTFDKNRTPSIASPDNDADFQKMLRTVIQGSGPIYFVAVNTDQNPSPAAVPNAFDEMQHKAARIRMSIVANRSNGVLHLPQKIEDVGALYERIGHELGYAYTVGFAPKTITHDGSFHKIEIRTTNKTLQVTTSREGYNAQ